MEWPLKLAGVLSAEVLVWASMEGALATVDEAGAFKGMCALLLQKKGETEADQKEGSSVCRLHCPLWLVVADQTVAAARTAEAWMAVTV